MKALLINTVCGIRSTGRICTDIAAGLEKEGYEVKIAYGREEVPDIYKKYAVRIGTDFDNKIHGLKTRIFDKQAFGSYAATKKFLKWSEEYNPDLLWLHNLHGYYINIELLFDFIKKRPNMKVKWTLHDCWAFTGHCTHFTLANCYKWKTRCENCPQKKAYPASILLDNSRENFCKKKKLFCGVNNLEIITPSKWLADLVGQSFLNEYSINVLNNKIDTDVFKPTSGNLREKYGLQDKKIILGVASLWCEQKGFYDFIKLEKLINDKSKIVLVGLDDEQIKNLPKKIIGINRTNNAKELAEIYSMADLFFNPTYEDNFPTVNLEAEACGTPVITYNTGGAPETLKRDDSMVIEVGNYKIVADIVNGEL